LRKKRRIWIVSGIEGIKGGGILTSDYGSDYFREHGADVRDMIG